MGAIDLDPCSNSREIPNVPAARHYTAQDNGLVQPWEGRVFLNPPFGPGVEQWFSKLYLERVRRPDHGGDCAVEVGDRDRCVEDADGDIVPGVFSFSKDTVYRARDSSGFQILAGTVLCRGCARAIHDGFYSDRARMESSREMNTDVLFLGCI